MKIAMKIQRTKSVITTNQISQKDITLMRAIMFYPVIASVEDVQIVMDRNALRVTGIFLILHLETQAQTQIIQEHVQKHVSTDTKMKVILQILSATQIARAV